MPLDPEKATLMSSHLDTLLQDTILVVLSVAPMVSIKVQSAIKHWMIAAKLGQIQSLENKHGFGSKEDFTSALRGYQAAVDATKSVLRAV